MLVSVLQFVTLIYCSVISNVLLVFLMFGVSFVTVGKKSVKS